MHPASVVADPPASDVVDRHRHARLVSRMSSKEPPPPKTQHRDMPAKSRAPQPRRATSPKAKKNEASERVVIMNNRSGNDGVGGDSYVAGAAVVGMACHGKRSVLCLERRSL